MYKGAGSWITHFRNKSYLGIGKAGELEIPEHHEPIITRELWDAVKQVEQSSPRFGKSGKPFHPQRIKHPSLLLSHVVSKESWGIRFTRQSKVKRVQDRLLILAGS
ncbi:MAG: recombinase family protein [Terrimicrobiaceae bacterium]